jgi:plasmid stabilization system protein ParE
MARVIWTEPALSDLDGIADYIALDDPEAAKRLPQKKSPPMQMPPGSAGR